jgi:hypothetical protein
LAAADEPAPDEGCEQAQATVDRIAGTVIGIADDDNADQVTTMLTKY